MLSKEEAYAAIEQLVICFGEQIQGYKKTDYNETLVRRDFIDPFLKPWVGTWTAPRAMPKPTGK